MQVKFYYHSSVKQNKLTLFIPEKLRSESPLYNSSYNTSVNRSTELYSTRRDLYSPQNTPKSGSYSPSRQSPAKFERLSSPRRDLYSPPRHETELYSTTYKSESKNEFRDIKKSLSPAPRVDDIYSSRLLSPSPVRQVMNLKKKALKNLLTEN